MTNHPIYALWQPASRLAATECILDYNTRRWLLDGLFPLNDMTPHEH